MICILPGLPAFYVNIWLSIIKWYHTHFLLQNSMERVAHHFNNHAHHAVLLSLVIYMCNDILAFFRSTTHSSGVSACYASQQQVKGVTMMMKMAVVSSIESKCSYQ